MTNVGPSASTQAADGTALTADNFVDSIGEFRWNPVVTLSGNDQTMGILCHSATTYSAMASAIFQSSDSGATWTNRNAALDTDSIMIGGRTDKTIGFCTETAAAAEECAYTSDSGATWTTKTTSNWGTATGVVCCSMPSSSLIVLGGNDGAGAKHIVFSTDQATTWTDATTAPAAAVYAVSMFNNTTGYAVDLNGDIWKTVNGAVDWADTTHNAGGVVGTGANIYAVSATTVIGVDNNGLFLYDNTGGTVTQKSGGIGTVHSIIEKTNGEIVLMGKSATITFLLKTNDDGVSWVRAEIAHSGYNANLGIKGGLSELGTNNLMIAGRVDLTKIFEGD